MKTNLLLLKKISNKIIYCVLQQRIITFTVALLSFQNIHAQVVKLIAGPPFSTYQGFPVIYNNKLYLQYTVNFVSHLAVYNDADKTVQIIDNPDNSQYGYVGNPVVYNGKLYIIYISSAGYYQLAEFDGTQLKLIPNPDKGGLSGATPIIYNNKLYVQYSDESGSGRLGQVDGDTFTLIANPGENMRGYEGYPIIYKDILYFSFANKTDASQLASFNGNVITLIPNPNSSVDGYYVRNPVIFNNKLYITYKDYSLPVDHGQLAVFDGNSLSLINNPPNINYIGNPFVFNNTLLGSGSLQNEEYKYQVMQYDGKSFTLIANPGSDNLGNDGQYYPVVYKDSLYINSRGLNYFSLSKYIPASNSFVAIPNPDKGNGYEGISIVHNGLLYINYNDGFTTHLASFNGSNISIIQDPDPIYSFYDGTPFIYNNKLFMQFDTFDGSQLAYLDESVLAVKLINFSASLEKNDAVLRWQTATETNSAWFSIQRSNDGIHFNNIGKVKAAGNSSRIESYAYTDMDAAALQTSKLYYRIQEADNDGMSEYTTIKSIDLATNFIYSVSPNPAADFINITSSADKPDVQIKITDLNGRVLYTTRQNLVKGQQFKISLSQFSKQLLIFTIKDHNQEQHFKVMKR